MKQRSGQGPIYSTDHGALCPLCGKPRKCCVCGKMRRLNTGGDGIVRVGRETSGRKGSGVSVIKGIQCTAEQLKELARQLKQKCGTGGMVKGDTIEIQGDHRDRIIEELTRLGYKAKKAGG